MKKLIILDWDDTVVSGGFELYYGAYRTALERVNAAEESKEERKIVYDTWGRSHREVLQMLLGKHKDRLEDAVKEYHAILLSPEYSSHIELIPGAKHALLSLCKEYTIAIASSGNPALIKNVLIPKLGLESLFSRVLTSSDLVDPTMGKPHPELANLILSQESCEADEAVLVGDSPLDIKMAIAAGILPIAVLTGRLTPEEAASAGAKETIDSLTHLPEIMEDLAIR